MKKRTAIYFFPGGIFFLMFFFLSIPVSFPAESDSGLVLDEGMQIGLGDSFFTEEDYYRAITEYKRFLFFFPKSLRTEEVLWKIAKSYLNGKKWDEAISAGDDLINKFPDSTLAADIFFLKGLCYSEKKEFSQARRFFQKAQERSPASFISNESQWQIALTYLKEEKWKEATEEFQKINKTSKLYPKAESFSQGLSALNEIPQKSPGIAGILSAILPGSGHLYCGRYRDAIIAFLLNGSFIWGMMEAFENKEYIIGGILTFFELGWYSGNIYSAVSSTNKFNQKKRQEFLEKLESQVNLSMGVSFQGKIPLLIIKYAF